MGDRTPHARRAVDTGLLVASHVFVVAVLLLHWGSLSARVVDVPFADDWRHLRPGAQLLPDHLDLSWIFLGANRTLYATGKILDQLFFTYTSGSYAIHQQVSSAFVLGTSVLLTARLLARAALPLPWHVLGVVSMVYLLQVRTYWGTASLAYHQALPVVCLLVVLWIATRDRLDALRAALLAAVALAGGLAYVSGAIAMLGVGIWLVAVALWLRPATSSRGRLHAGLVVLGTGAVTLALQLALVPDVTLREAKAATPLDWQFWHYLFHQVARALGDVSEDSSSAMHAGVMTLVVFGVTGAATLRSLHRARSADAQTGDASYAVVAGGLLVAVASFLVVISYARSNPEVNTDALALVRAAKVRFHYWWVTPLLPWAAVAPGLLGRRGAAGAHAGLRRWLAPAAVACVLASQASLKPWRFDAYYQLQGARRMNGVRCLASRYPRPGPLRCPMLVGLAPDQNLRPHVENARRLGVPFAKRLE